MLRVYKVYRPGLKKLLESVKEPVKYLVEFSDDPFAVWQPDLYGG